MVSPSTRLLRGFILLLLIIVTTCLLLDVDANDVVDDGMVVNPNSRDKVMGGRKLMVQPSGGEETVQKGKRSDNYKRGGNGGSTSVRRKSRRSLNSLHLKMNNNSKVVDFTADYHLPKSHPPKHN